MKGIYENLDTRGRIVNEARMNAINQKFVEKTFTKLQYSDHFF